MGNGTPLRVIHRQSAVIQRRIQIKKCEIHITRLAEFEAKRKRTPTVVGIQISERNSFADVVQRIVCGLGPSWKQASTVFLTLTQSFSQVSPWADRVSVEDSAP
jgi:hypothetical protein